MNAANASRQKRFDSGTDCERSAICLKQGGVKMFIAMMVFIITTIVFAIGRIKWKVSTCALLCYLEKKGYTQPSDDEIAECTEYAARHILSDFLHGKKI